MTLKTFIISSLDKVFPDSRETDFHILPSGSVLKNEVFSFQIVYRSDEYINDLSWEINSVFKDKIKVRQVGLVPAEFIGFLRDDNILRRTAGLFPDPLYEIADEKLKSLPEQWHSLWVTVKTNSEFLSGKHQIVFDIASESKGISEQLSFDLEIINAELPEQEIKRTEWFHTDCIASLHGVDVWSDKHWELLGKYFKNAVGHGINMLLTPLFTPPLDTAVGGERPTVQLIDIERQGKHFLFDFSRLKKWLALAMECGFKYFEFSHFFTQWGAEFTPKIIARDRGEEIKLFGWEVKADSIEYRDFMSSLLPELRDFLNNMLSPEQCYFHVSDEPHLKDLENYSKAKSLIKDILQEFQHIDALSNTEFYKKGMCQIPVPSVVVLDLFMQLPIQERWCYYCGFEQDKVPNRFLNFPSPRNRILGFLLYKYDLDGFLHWGYNFWYSRYSKEVIDPYKVTDAGREFAAGDAFLVYPGENGPRDSIRHEVLFEAFQDLRALKLLESFSSREEVIKLIENKLENPLTMKIYPQEADWLTNTREVINQTIKLYSK